MENKKAEDIKIINLKNIKNSVTDYFVLATGNSNIHIDSIAEGIEEDVFKKFHEKPWSKEGKEMLNGYLLILLMLLPMFLTKKIEMNII